MKLKTTARLAGETIAFVMFIAALLVPILLIGA